MPWLTMLSVAVVLGTAAGCGPNRDWAPVSGQITLDDEPQERIYVFFYPNVPEGGDPQDTGASSYALTDADGRYTLNFMDLDKDRPGALVGNHTVKLDDELTYNSMTAKSRVPKGWETTFVVTQEGTTEANFEINQR